MTQSPGCTADGAVAQQSISASSPASFLLAVIAIWGIWFGVQSVLTLWWPINLAYLLAGLMVAIICGVVARALLAR